jgi:NAD-dependent dihydropyrimidine dehydrogenase PreA subunit
MPIDPEFHVDADPVRTHDGHDVWGPIDPPDDLGVHGTHVAVDFDVCVGDGACLDDCPVDVFDWVETPGHGRSDRKADPAREGDCVDCMLCVDVCPVAAIDVDADR